jgi:hypothetical protein
MSSQAHGISRAHIPPEYVPLTTLSKCSANLGRDVFFDMALGDMAGYRRMNVACVTEY